MSVFTDENGKLVKGELEKGNTFGEMFDFNNMFRVKGKSGLVSVVSHKKGSKICVVCDIYTQKSTRSEKINNMVCLGSSLYLNNNGEYIGLTEVFNHLMHYVTNSEDYAFEKVSVDELMPLMVPDFDENEFKLYHAKQVLGWYIEVTLKYSALIDEKVEAGEVQLLTEEKK